MHCHVIANSPGIPTHTTSNADGHFTFSNIGDDRLAILQLEGPRMVTEYIAVVTRNMKPVQALAFGHLGPKDNTHYGATFSHVAQPGIVLEGTIRDEETGRPIAASLTMLQRRDNVISDLVQKRWTTDANGRYRIDGLPKEKGLKLHVIPHADQPYFAQQFDLQEARGLEPQTFDVELRRGVMITGKLTDRRTGKPIRWARFSYFPLLSNDDAQKYSRYQTSRVLLDPMGYRFISGEDGSFRIVGIPGAGIVGVRINDPKYLKGVGANKLDHLKHDSEKRFKTYDYCSSQSLNVLALAQIKPGEDEITLDLQADAGESIEFEFIDAGGKPLTDVTINRHHDREARANKSTVYGFIEGRTRTVYFKDEIAKLGKSVTVTGVPAQRSRKLILLPFGKVTGQIVKNDGEPAFAGRVRVSQEPVKGSADAPNHALTLVMRDISPDRNGRFEINGLLPDGEYTFYVSRAGKGTKPVRIPDRYKIEAGKTVDLGVINITTGEIHPPKGK